MARNGGRSFSRTLGSFRSYSHRTLRTIRTRWNNFKAKHPAATKYAKWVSWLSGIAVSVGSAVSLQVELYRTFHTHNHTDAEIMTRIENVTNQLDRLYEDSMKEYAAYPDKTIHELYNAPLRRDSRGTYQLGIEDIPRDEDQPERMDPLFQDISGLPEEVASTLERTTRTTPMLDINQTNRQRMSPSTPPEIQRQQAVWKRGSPGTISGSTSAYLPE